MHNSVKVCYVFNMVTMYVTAFSGSFLISGNPLELTQHIARDIVIRVDSVSGYLMCYILTQLAFRMAVFLLRPYKIFPWLLYNSAAARARSCWLRCFGDTEQQLEADRACADISAGALPVAPTATAVAQADAEQSEFKSDGTSADQNVETTRWLLMEPACYDWILTDLSIVLALCTMYGVIAPVLVLAAFPFFWGYMGMVRYNLVFVYTQDFDGGGGFFFSLTDRVFFTLLVSLLLLEAYLLTLRTHFGVADIIAQHAALPILMFGVSCVWYNLRSSYKRACRALSLQTARDLDEREDLHRARAFREPAYEDPVVREARGVAGIEWRSRDLVPQPSERLFPCAALASLPGAAAAAEPTPPSIAGVLCDCVWCLFCGPSSGQQRPKR